MALLGRFGAACRQCVCERTAMDKVRSAARSARLAATGRAGLAEIEKEDRRRSVEGADGRRAAVRI